MINARANLYDRTWSTIMQKRCGQVVRSATIMSMMVAALGCYGDRGAVPVVVDPGSALGHIIITPRNTILAIGGTVQPSISATSLSGDPVTQMDSVKYLLPSLADSVRVKVTRDGLLTGLAVTSAPVAVNAIGFLHSTMQGDQVLVQVTPAPVVGLTLSIQPPSGDSTKLASGTAKTITPVLRNPGTGASVSGVQMKYEVKPADENRLGVYFSSIADGNVLVRIGRDFVSPSAGINQILPYVSEGTAWVYATVNAYGTVLQDSVLYTFTYPYTATIAASKQNLAVMTRINGASPFLSPGLTATVTFAPGAIVTFSSSLSSTDPLTVAFTLDNPAAATAPAISPSTTGGSSGNVTPLTGGQSSRRQFLTPGTYHWTMVTAGGPAPWPGQTFVGTMIIKP